MFLLITASLHPLRRRLQLPWRSAGGSWAATAAAPPDSCLRSPPTLEAQLCTDTHTNIQQTHGFLSGRPAGITYRSRAGLLFLLSTMEAAEPLPSRTDCTMATGRTGGSEEQTWQVEVMAAASPPSAASPFPPPRTPGLTGSSLMSIMLFCLSVEAETVSNTKAVFTPDCPVDSVTVG